MIRICAVLTLLTAAGSAAAQPSAVLRDQHFASAALGHEGRFTLYLPPDRDGLTSLPVIYLLHGVDSNGDEWVDRGDLPAAADRLIAAGTLPKMLIVMPDGGNSWYVGAMGRALMQELPDWIETHYPVARARQGRAVAGFSMGGFGALRFALLQPERYAAVVGMSSALWTSLKPDTQLSEGMLNASGHIFAGAFGTPFEPSLFIAASPITLARHLDRSVPPPAILMISGQSEPFDAASEQQQLRQLLAEAGVPATVEITDGKHDWDNWRGMLPDVLTFLGKELAPPASAPMR